MKVHTVMTKDVRVVNAKSSLAVAGEAMAEFGCGVLPVVDAQSKVIGILTDRDVCVTLARRNQLASQIPVYRAMSTDVVFCGPDDDIQMALRTMRSQQVRRLPVLGDDGALVGILSMDDVVVNATSWAGNVCPEVTPGEAVVTLRAIYGSRSARIPPVPPVSAPPRDGLRSMSNLHHFRPC
jgi:CBS domain-containing protein